MYILEIPVLNSFQTSLLFFGERLKESSKHYIHLYLHKVLINIQNQFWGPGSLLMSSSRSWSSSRS